MTVGRIVILIWLMFVASMSPPSCSFLIETSDEQMHVFVKGLAVDPSHGNKTYDVTALCECRIRAWSWQPSISWSYNPTTQECILSAGPLESSSTKSMDSHFSYHYNYTTSSERIEQRVDGLYYFYSEDPRRTFAQAKAYCESFPGFRLPSIITQEQYQVVVFDIHALTWPFWLDLYGTVVSDLVWGNDISFNVTIENTGKTPVMDNTSPFAFDVYNNIIHDIRVDFLMYTVCQGNLDAVPWTR